jgi:hypothetical protein
MSGLINKVKDALHSDKDKTHHEQPEGTHGTHNSRAANAADPRFDSDRDHRANPATTTTGGLGGSSAHTGPTAGGLGHSTGAGHRSENLPEGTVGPHGSRVANAADPRVDSDLDSSRNTHGGNTGLPGSTHSSGLPGSNNNSRLHEGTGAGLGHSTGAGHTTGGIGSTGGLGGSSAHTGAGHTTGGIGHRSENLPGSTHTSGLHEGSELALALTLVV